LSGPRQRSSIRAASKKSRKNHRELVNDLPIMRLPLNLSDESVASRIEFAHEPIEALERRCAGQLLRHARQHATSAPMPVSADPPNVNPPF